MFERVSESIAEISLGHNARFISVRVFESNSKVNARAGILEKWIF